MTDEHRRLLRAKAERARLIGGPPVKVFPAELICLLDRADKLDERMSADARLVAELKSLRAEARDILALLNEDPE